MILLVFILAFFVSGIFTLLTLQVRKPGDRFIILLIYYLLLCLAIGIVISVLLGVAWHPYLQMAAFVYITVYWMRQIWVSSFWGKLLNETWLILHLFIGGYLYAATQIPYENKPFAPISINAPLPLTVDQYAVREISGLPIVKQLPPSTLAIERLTTKKVTKITQHSEPMSLSWESIAPLMQKDSHIHRVMYQLKKEQESTLSALLANLNDISANSTQMRRHALNAEQILDLLQEQAISNAHYQTLLETWRLLDDDEHAFKIIQTEARFQALLGLLEDDKVDESYKVEFIDYMSQQFSGDVRLIKPLIHLYDQLDEAYPRQKRLNHVFMALYIAKREALINAFKAMGEPIVKPLMDYRNKTVSHITYSQARLDLFLQHDFGVKLRPLYGVSNPLSLRDFLNRQKYPPLHKLTGASFEQDHIRRSLLALAEENSLPEREGPVMGLNIDKYNEIMSQIVGQSSELIYSDKLDYWLIHPDPVIRANLAWCLASIKSPSSVPLIFDLMKDQHPDVRRFAAIAVGNFTIVDAQGANDQKFIEIIRMLQNYRSNSDSFARGWAVLALSGVGDKQKALYVIDLLLNDGTDSDSIVGTAASAWRSEEEQAVMQSWVETLKRTPEDLWVKTQALTALIAIDSIEAESPESLAILLHYLRHTYAVTDDKPTLWRYIAPHFTLPQEAENAEDAVFFLADKYRHSSPATGKQDLKALRMGLWQAFQNHQSGDFFQILSFLRQLDVSEYQAYLIQNEEQIRLMRILEYFHATYWFWLICWPISLLCVLVINYSLLPMLSFSLPAHKTRYRPNQRANPAADGRNKTVPPASAIVPIKLTLTDE